MWTSRYVFIPRFAVNTTLPASFLSLATIRISDSDHSRYSVSLAGSDRGSDIHANRDTRTSGIMAQTPYSWCAERNGPPRREPSMIIRRHGANLGAPIRGRTAGSPARREQFAGAAALWSARPQWRPGLLV